jgi:hypothetical protein
MNGNETIRVIASSESVDDRDDVITPELLADLLVVGSLDPALANCIAEAIHASEGMLNGPRILILVKKCVGHADESVSSAIARVILNFSLEMKNELLVDLAAWRLGSEARRLQVSEELYANIRRNLDVMIQDDHATQLLHKSRRLQRDTGNELYSVKCLCDVRPIFDAEHASIEGFVSLVNFQLGYKKQNQQYETLELALTEEELQWIVSKANDALKKLKLLQDTLSESGEEGAYP